MKKLAILMFLVMGVGRFAGAQERLIKKFGEKIKSRVEQRVDEGMDKSIDKAESSAKKAGTAKSTGSVKQSPDSQQPVNQMRPFVSYSKFDFLRGENVLYAEDFAADVVGEFPLKWSTNSRGEVVMIEGMPNKWLRLFPGGRVVSPRFSDVPDSYTLEFDIVISVTGDEGYVIPEVITKLLHSAGEQGNRYFDSPESDAVTFTLEPVQEDDLRISFRSLSNGQSYLENHWKSLKSTGNYQEKVHHVSIWVQKERLRLWVNSEKVYDMPQAVPLKMRMNRLEFEVPSSIYADENLGIYISDIRLAEGVQDLRTKLLNDGQVSTTGILFAVSSAEIKGESYGILKEIAAVLKGNPQFKLKIVGHTDSDGDDASNLELSKRRAESVKRFLTNEGGIEGSRLVAEGMGETKPVAENSSNEGKAKNRRVEFLRTGL